MNLFKRKPDPKEFWDWFTANAGQISAVRSADDPTVARVAKRFRNAFPELSFEVAKVGDEFNFVVSADGIRENIESVKEVVESAPAIPGWNVVAFRQPAREGATLTYNGRELSADSIFYTCEDSADKLDVVFYIEGLSKDSFEDPVGACFLLLDATIGEYAVMTQIGEIDFRPLTEVDGTQQPLSSLPDRLNAMAST